MRVNYFFIMVAVFSIFFTIGCSDYAEKEPRDIDQLFPPAMLGQIMMDGMAYPIKAGAYRWERRDGLGTEIVQTDHASPYQSSKYIEAIHTNSNQKIEIKIEEDPAIKVYLWNENGREKEIKLEDNQIVLPSDNGKYIYEVAADWPNGTISYTFVIEIR
ncbi:hypothetical protein [Lysinibacillus odysseyi]|nr:hypothetical protein [Lysinibacillus odysseyi]